MKTFHFVDKTGYCQLNIPAANPTGSVLYLFEHHIDLEGYEFLGVSLPLPKLRRLIEDKRKKFSEKLI